MTTKITQGYLNKLLFDPEFFNKEFYGKSVEEIINIIVTPVMKALEDGKDDNLLEYTTLISILVDVMNISEKRVFELTSGR